MKQNTYTILEPTKAKEFKCIGSKCEDTCCKGWQINIDQMTYQKYKHISNIEWKNKLKNNTERQRSNIHKEQYAKFKLNKQKRCHFLREDMLCDIHNQLGEEYLCNTCAVYPSQYNKINHNIEHTLTLSCPEAARLILLNKEGIQFEERRYELKRIIISRTEVTQRLKKKSYKEYFYEIRYVTIGILQAREYSLQERLLILGILYDEIGALTEKEMDTIPDILGRYLELMEQGGLKEILREAAPNHVAQLRLSKELTVYRMLSHGSSDRYLKCSREMMEGLKIGHKLSQEEELSIYIEAYKTYFKPFMEKYDYILENYLVNYVLFNAVPVAYDDIFDNYTMLVVSYALAKLHLIGVGVYRGKLDEEIAVEVIQVITKEFEHNYLYTNKVLAKMKETQNNQLKQMTTLVID